MNDPIQDLVNAAFKYPPVGALCLGACWATSVSLIGMTNNSSATFGLEMIKALPLNLVVSGVLWVAAKCSPKFKVDIKIAILAPALFQMAAATYSMSKEH